MVMEDTEGHNFLKMVALTLEDKQKLLSSLEHIYDEEVLIELEKYKFLLMVAFTLELMIGV